MHQTIDYSDALNFPPKGDVTIGESNNSLVHVSGPQDPKLTNFVKKYGGLKAALTMPSRNTHIPHHHKVNAALEEMLEDTKSLGIIPQPIINRIEELLKDWDIESIFNTAGDAWKKAWDIYISMSGSYNEIIRHDKLAKLLIRKIAFHPHQSLLAIALWNDTVWVYDLSVESWYSCGLSHPFQSQIMKLEWKPMSGVVLAIGCEDGVALWHVFRDHKPTGAEAAWAEPNPLKDRPSELISETYCKSTRTQNRGQDSAWIGRTRIDNLSGVDYLSWDPQGELLAIASLESSIVYIRDGTTNQLTELRLNMKPSPPQFVRSIESLMETVSKIKNAIKSLKPEEHREVIAPTHEQGFYGAAVCCLSWSPCGKYLLVGYTSEVARIYEAATWEYIDMKGLTGAIQSAVWTPEGYNLIYSLQGDDLVRAIHLERRAGELTTIPLNYMKMSLRKEDIHSYKSELRSMNDEQEKSKFRETLWRRHGYRRLEDLEEFGPIEELVIDPSGERLVVRFKNTDLLGIVIVRPTMVMLQNFEILMPSGFIQGPGWTDEQSDEDEDRDEEPKALTMAFTRHNNGVSILSMAWESGQINFVPFYYLTQSEVDTL
ncbi:hypothetical protein BGZ76_009623 [Entomortierella beljakovae]|nr:hypothetical protein BGZ76_009623 [Entomortierella beljakovae]